MPTILAGLWSRPSSSTLNRPPGQNLIHLKDAVAAHRNRVRAAGMAQQHGMKGLLLAPEYYFANSKSGTWNQGIGNYRTRTISQTDKEVIVEGLKKISAEAPDTVLVPGSRTPLQEGHPW